MCCTLLFHFHLPAVLAAGAPHIAPFMADECLLAMPDVDSLDYTMKEYMRFVEMVNVTVERLNAQGMIVIHSCSRNSREATGDLLLLNDRGRLDAAPGRACHMDLLRGKRPKT